MIVYSCKFEWNDGNSRHVVFYETLWRDAANYFAEQLARMEGWLGEGTRQTGHREFWVNGIDDVGQISRPTLDYKTDAEIKETAEKYSFERYYGVPVKGVRL